MYFKIIKLSISNAPYLMIITDNVMSRSHSGGTIITQSLWHYNDVILGAMASQITSLTIVYSTVYSRADQRKHQTYASLAFVRGIRRRPANSPHKWPVTRKVFPFDDVIMEMFTGKNTVLNIKHTCIYRLKNLRYKKVIMLCLTFYFSVKTRYLGQGWIITFHSALECNHISMPLIRASGTQVHIYHS